MRMDDEKTKTETSERRRLRDLQRRNTRETSALKVIEKTNRVIKPVLLTIPPVPAILLNDAIKEKDDEIVRLRRALVRTQIRLERTTASLLPRLRSKANEVRTLRKQIDPTNEKGSRLTPKRQKLLEERRARLEAAEKAVVSGKLPPLDAILEINQQAAEREKVKSTAR